MRWQGVLRVKAIKNTYGVSFAKDARAGWTTWVIFLVGISIALAVVPERSGVTHVYREALQHWLAGQDLYEKSGHGFLYLPISAVLYFPLLLKPTLLGEIIWRVFTVGTFAWGTWRISLLAAEWLGRPVFAIVSVVGAILAMPGGRDGQTTLPMAGLFMIAMVEAAAGRDVRLGLAAVGSLLLKPLSIPLMLLLGACRLRSVPTMIAGTVALLLVPFLLADQEWVVQQYTGFRYVLTMTEKLSGDKWATLSGMVVNFGISVAAPVRHGMALTAAFVTLWSCLLAWKSLRPPEAATTMYSLAMLWLMLFSPRTENNTYVCMAPTLGFGIATGLYGAGPTYDGKSRLRATLYMVAVALVIGTYELGRIIVPGPANWLAPLVCTFVLLDVWYGVFLGPKRDKAKHN